MAAYVWIIAVLSVSAVMVASGEEDCDIYSDVLFILDKSKSIKRHQWVIMRNAVSKIASNMDIGRDKIRVGMLLFANDHHKKWCFDKYDTKEEVIQAIKELECPECGKGQTSTGIAMEYARTDMMTAECGLRDARFRKTVILMTDGKSTEVKKLGKPKNWVESQSDNLIAATNASIVAVGIGKYRYTELVEIASSKDLVVPVDNFKELDKFVTKLSYTASGCPQPTVQPLPDCKLDLVFLLDKSTSIKRLHWMLEKEFTKEIIKHYKISQEGVRVAISLYSSGVHDKFCFNKFNDRDDLLKAIDKLRCPECGSRRTAIGASLQNARERLLTESCGDRPDVDDFVILISDGKSTEPEEFWRNQSALMKQHVRDYFTVGVGKSKLKHLKQMAGEKSNALHYFDFERLINNIDKSLHRTKCHVPLDRERDQCDEGWKYDVWRKTCIKFFSKPVHYNKARKNCIKWAAEMPTVEDNNDATFQRLLSKKKEIWIPLKANRSFNKFKWAKGQELGKKRRWKKGEPDMTDKSKKCVIMSGKTSRWVNKQCKKKYSSFCVRGIKKIYFDMDDDDK